ncbi:MAG: GIY-YIG nuclease family protein [Candidatus Nanopelagicaceae bacterium]|nr:GIY-YIG nuclease family protein [Candidatus Nanopelagicaceae bacterium]
MILTSGEIYFIGEFDLKTGQRTEYVKIGIVRHGAKEDRTSQDRLLEHQTGNPRRLEIIHTVTTDAVESIETNLHYRFARHRVYGEWMRLDSTQLEEAKSEAESLRDQLATHVETFRRADELKNQLSNEGKLAPTIDSEYWFAKYQDSKIMSKACDEAIEKYNALLSTAADEGEEVSEFVTVQERAGARRFDLKAFMEKHPDIYSKFITKERSVKSRFTVTSVKKWNRTLEEISPDLSAILTQFESELEKVEGNSITTTIHNLYLGVISMQAYADWEMQLASANIKNLCGYNEGIEGICTWKRAEQIDEKFDRKALTEAHPDIVEEFMVTSAPTKAVIVEPKAAYQD